MSQVNNIKGFGGRSLILSFALTVLALGTLFVQMNYQHKIPEIAYFFIPIFLSLLIVLVITPCMIWLAHKIDFLDYPTENRKDHAKPIPLLGGLGIYCAFLSVSLLYWPWPDQFQSIMIASTILFVVGLIDDYKSLSSTVRLLSQLAAAILIMSSGLTLSFMPETWWGISIGVFLTLMWILGISNAFNFSDGIDGLASGIALIASFFFFLITLQLKQYDVALMCSLIMGSCTAFLFYNFRPAKIYLGDGGSTLLGFLLASIALYGGWSEKGVFIALGIPSLILGVLIFDMCYITVSRIKNGLVHNIKEWLDFTGRDHFHHRLLHLGFRVEYAVIFIYLVCIILGISALILQKTDRVYLIVMVLFQAALVFAVVTFLMRIGRKLYIPKENVMDAIKDKIEKYDTDEKVDFITVENFEDCLHGVEKEDEDKKAEDKET